MKNKINLITMTDLIEFQKICEDTEGKIEVYCGKKGYRTNAKSILGCMAALEYEDMWVESEVDIYSKIQKWVVNGEDGANIHE